MAEDKESNFVFAVVRSEYRYSFALVPYGEGVAYVVTYRSDVQNSLNTPRRLSKNSVSIG